MFLNKKISFISGAICGLCFAPIYFFPAIFMLSILCRQILLSETKIEAVKYGYFFGFGFFITMLYWVSFAINVYIDQFWWAIPFALFGLPAFLAIFISLQSLISWYFRNYKFYHLIFSSLWILIEWIMSWIFTGFPWGLVGYCLSFSDIIIQFASISGIFGLSFFAVYIGSIFFNSKLLLSRIVTSCVILVTIYVFGYYRMEYNPTEYTHIKARIVQPSITQTAKWDQNIFWQNLDKHIELSRIKGNPDIIIWSEAALTLPYYHSEIYERLISVFTKDNQILLFGGVNDNQKYNEDYKIYSSLMALNNDGKLLFNYNKSHLVPFGEYMPLSDYIPIKKITDGMVDYSEGIRSTYNLESLDLKIQPFICYESIFPSEVRIDNNMADIIINITNDAWYGDSSGPYQHFEISRMRAIENGIPMIRAANNGISAVIDPVGRIIKKHGLNEIGVVDSYIPKKLSFSTIYSKNGNILIIAVIFCVLIIQLAIQLIYKKFRKL